MSELPLRWSTVLRGRLERQRLTQRAAAEEFLDVVAALGGVHAQLASSAELTLHARVDGLPPTAVARALDETRTLVKTWAVRGTLHLLPARELPTWVAALSTYRHMDKPSWQRAFLPADELRLLLDAVGEVLADALLTRAELADAVQARTGSVGLAESVRSSWGAVLKPAAFRGRLCFGPSDGQLVRFTRPDTWLRDQLGEWPPVDPDEALATLVRTYLRVQGPATREDLARWIALPPARAGALLRALGDEVVPVDVEGRRCVGLAATVAEDAARDDRDLGSGTDAADRVVRLLPAFDQYVVASSRDVEAVLAVEDRPRVFRPQGWISPVLLVDGRVEGVWRHERTGSRLEVAVEPFRPQPAVVRAAVEAEAARLESWAGRPVDLRWG